MVGFGELTSCEPRRCVPEDGAHRQADAGDPGRDERPVRQSGQTRFRRESEPQRMPRVMRPESRAGAIVRAAQASRTLARAGRLPSGCGGILASVAGRTRRRGRPA